MRILPLSLALFSTTFGCQCVVGNGGDGPPPDPPPVDAGPQPVDPTPGETPPSPVRRLTGEELNRTVRDLFPAAEALPTIELTEDRGKDFAQEVQRQVVSDLGVDQLRAGAIAVAGRLAEQQPNVLARQPRGPDDFVAAIDETLTDLLPRAFRRPVTAEERQRFVDYFAARLAAGDPFSVAMQLVLQAVLQSPSFIYRLELDGDVADADEAGRVPVSSVEMASRLSYFLWGSMPDDELLQAGIDGDLATEEGLTRQVDRLLGDPRFLQAMLSFHSQWLDFDRILRSNKSPERFPQYNETVRQAMRREADQFIALLVTEDPSLRALLTTRRTRLTPALGSIYGVNVTSDDQAVTLPEERAGFLTQAHFLASHGHALEGSPVLRGVFILERLVCEPPPIPDASIDITPPTSELDNVPQTNRDRYARHTTDTVCQSCHTSIDGIGFGLEAFDSVGQHRDTDNGFPVDASGNLDGTRIGGEFNGAVELGQKLAESDIVQDCVARHWFRFANGRREERGDEASIAGAVTAFAAEDTAIPALLRALVLTDAFRLRSVQ